MNIPDAPYTFSASPSPPAAQAVEAPRGPGRPKGSTGAKRGRKPRGAAPLNTASPRPTPEIPASSSPSVSSPQFHSWSVPGASSSNAGANANASVISGPSIAGPKLGSIVTSGVGQYTPAGGGGSGGTPTTPGYSNAFLKELAASANISASALAAAGLTNFSNEGPTSRVGSIPPPPAKGDQDGEGEDEMLPAMADEDYSAQLSFQSQSKDNLKILMENLSPEQYDRFEAYRRHALPKQAVRKVIQQTVGAQVSQPVAQIVAGFAKVFVGEIVEKARAVQARRGETGPLSPDHLREAYRMYQEETGRVGAARPLRAKRLFVR
ncbi:transcription initiation factor TFIID subunit 11 [Paramarasmius palmivorus]|uniref:Transcription initiation factor TFIID subunit 11 n=1 Tax=Paramarasmius palmivorus TaxID=297713 RepID=A0AAW0DDV8_9AGAR